MKNLILISVLALVLGACAHEPPPEEPAPLVITSAPDQRGQLPGKVVREAADQYGGSMTSETAGGAGMPAASYGAGAYGAGTGGTGSGGFTVVLGPVNAERLGSAPGATGDAGQSIREVISQRLTADPGLTLLDAPEERYINDSPRPDLARKGIKYVIKGVASHSAGSGEITVFLRAVDTRTGKVAMVASARNQSRDQAAGDAAAGILTKMIGTE